MRGNFCNSDEFLAFHSPEDPAVSTIVNGPVETIDAALRHPISVAHLTEVWRVDRTTQTAEDVTEEVMLFLADDHDPDRDPYRRHYNGLPLQARDIIDDRNAGVDC